MVEHKVIDFKKAKEKILKNRERKQKELKLKVNNFLEDYLNDDATFLKYYEVFEKLLYHYPEEKINTNFKILIKQKIISMTHLKQELNENRDILIKAEKLEELNNFANEIIKAIKNKDLKHNLVDDLLLLKAFNKDYYNKKMREIIQDIKHSPLYPMFSAKEILLLLEDLKGTNYSSKDILNLFSNRHLKLLYFKLIEKENNYHFDTINVIKQIYNIKNTNNKYIFLLIRILDDLKNSEELEIFLGNLSYTNHRFFKYFYSIMSNTKLFRLNTLRFLLEFSDSLVELKPDLEKDKNMTELKEFIFKKENIINIYKALKYINNKPLYMREKIYKDYFEKLLFYAKNRFKKGRFTYSLTYFYNQLYYIFTYSLSHIKAKYGGE